MRGEKEPASLRPCHTGPEFPTSELLLCERNRNVHLVSASVNGYLLDAGDPKLDQVPLTDATEEGHGARRAVVREN